MNLTDPARGVLPLVVTIAVQALVSLAALAAPVMAPAAALSTGVPAGWVGIFVGVVYAAACASTLVAGDLVSRFGPIRMSQVSLVLCGLGLFAAALATPASLVLSAVLIGLGYGPVTPASSHILIRTTPPHRMSLTFSLKQTGVPLGGMLAGLMVPLLIHGFGWQGAAICLGVAVLAMAAVTQTIRPMFDSDRDPLHLLAPSRALRPLMKVLATPALRDLGFCSFFFGAMQLCLTSFLVLYLTEARGVSLVTAGSILAVAQVAGVVGRLGWGWMADKLIVPRLLLGLLGLGMGAAGISLAMIGPDVPVLGFALIAAIFGASAIGWNGVFLAEVARLAAPGEVGAATGASLFLTYAGVVVGPPAFAGLVAQSHSYPLGFLAFGALLSAVGLFLMLTGPRRGGRQASARAS